MIELQRCDSIGAPPVPDKAAFPFVKWAGGKRQILPRLLEHVPSQFGRYFEPFVGGAALYFSLRPERATIADVNTRLIRTYAGVRDRVEEVIALLERYPYDETFFYEMRSVAVDALGDAEVAAWFIYLNRAGFNGLYRVNKRNVFNVPFGRYSNPSICNAPALRAASAALAHVELRNEDFEAVVAHAALGDFVYFDPPYVPLSATSSFTSYARGGFGADEQRRLRDVALALKRRGVHVVLSNSSAPLVYELYAEQFEIVEVSARRNVNSVGNGRGAITELIIR